MSDGDIVVNLLLSPAEINFLQVAVDGLITVQRDVIYDSSVSSDLDVVESGKDAIARLQAGLGLKQTLEVYNL